MKIRFLFIFIFLSLNGCSLIYSFNDNLPKQINQWISDKKFKLALNTIRYIKPKHKYYRIIQQQRKIIIKKIIFYENKAIEKSRRLSKQGDWILALKLLDETSDNIIDTTKIDKLRNKLLKLRANKITSYENDVLNTQVTDLLNKMALYEKINRTVQKNENNELEIKNFDLLRQATSTKLTKRSKKQYSNGQYDLALTTINLALKLKPNRKIVYDLKNIKKSIVKKTKLNRLTYISELKTLLSKLSQGYSHSILRKTKIKIDWLDKIKGNEKVYVNYISQLKIHLSAGAKQHFAAARKLYSKGKIQEALSIWHDLEKLDPEHPKLKAHIARAEKVLRKLKKLSSKPKK